VVRCDTQAAQQHRVQCGPVHINLGTAVSPDRNNGPLVGGFALVSPANEIRARGGRQRSACFGLVEADVEEAAGSSVEQRYQKVLVPELSARVVILSVHFRHTSVALNIWKCPTGVPGKVQPIRRVSTN
jgi:hypothetical protein